MERKKIGGGILLSLVALSTSARADDAQTLENNIISNLLANGSPSDATATSDMTALTSNGTFSNVNYTTNTGSNWGEFNHINQLHDMAVVWANPNSSLFQSSTLQADIVSAYSWWVAADPQNSNWWYNDIGVPDSLSETMLILQKYSALPASNFQAGATVVDSALAPQSGLSAANLVWTAEATVNEGVLRYLDPAATSSAKTSATTLIQNSFVKIGSTFTITTSDGVQKDYSYHAHGPLLYNGGYGSAWLDDSAAIASEIVGTSYTIPAANVDLLIDYLLNGTQWMIRGQNYDLTTVGRDISRTGQTNLVSSLVPTVARMLAVGDGYRQTELVSLQNRLNLAESEKKADPSNTLSGNRQFWTSDYMVQQRPAYMLSVKTLSSRTNGTESINQENLKGLFTYSGVNVIQQTGNEYNNIEPVWDWYRLPGTTTERSSNGVGGSYSLVPTGARGPSPFAGGASNGTYGATGYVYSQLNVSADKSWFMFDKEEVALGSGINAPNAGATDLVGTNINQTLLNGTVTYSTAAGQSTTLAAEQTISPANLRWVNHDGVGYFFLTPVSNATISTITQTGSWTDINHSYTGAASTGVFSLDLNHGVRPSGASYAYMVVPGMTASGMDAYLASNPVTISENDTTAQVVTDNGLGLTEATIYSPTAITLASGQRLTQTTTAQGSSVLAQMTGYTLNLSVASPQASTGTLVYQITGDFTGTNAVWNASGGYTTLSFPLPAGTSAGATLTQSFVLVASPSGGFYFTGGINGNWNTISGGNSNFATTPAGTANSGAMPSSASDVYLAATSASNLNTMLGQDFTINSLTLTGSGTAGTNSINVSGTNTLKLMAAAGTYAAGVGIMINAGAAVDTISANVALGASQSWNNSSASLFTVSGNVSSGANTLTKAGPGPITISGNVSGSAGLTLASGTLTLSGNNTYIGNTTITGGNLLVTSSTGLGTSTVVSANTGTGSGTLQLAGGITLTNAITKLGSRYDPAGNPSGVAQIENISGNNTLTSPLSIAGPGGSGVLIESDAGLITLSGGIAGNLSGSTYIRPFYLYGTGDGQVTGPIVNGVPVNGISINKEGTGTWTFAAADTYTGATTVNGGTLVFAAPSALPDFNALTINAGATATAAAHTVAAIGAAKNNLFTSSLTLAGTTRAWTAKLDLTNNDLIVQNGSLAQITSQIAEGFNNGAWNGGGGIVSSAAAADSTHLTALGVIQNSANGAANGTTLYTSSNPFDGATAYASTDVLVKFTWYGDTDLNGKVDGTDYGRIDNAYLADLTNSTAYTGWFNGDFNYDGVINGSDYTLIDNAFNTQGARITTEFASATAQIAGTLNNSAVPEPAALGLLGFAAAGLLGRRCRRA